MIELRFIIKINKIILCIYVESVVLLLFFIFMIDFIVVFVFVNLLNNLFIILLIFCLISFLLFLWCVFVILFIMIDVNNELIDFNKVILSVDKISVVIFVLFKDGIWSVGIVFGMVLIFLIILFSERFLIIGNFIVSFLSKEENKGSKVVILISVIKLDGIVLIYLLEIIIIIIVNIISKKLFCMCFILFKIMINVILFINFEMIGYGIYWM